jgi:transcription initiation factor IIE alpha subunit
MTATRQSTLLDYITVEFKGLHYHGDNWKIIDQLKKTPGLTASELSKKCDLLSRETSRRLHFLASIGIIKDVVAGKTRRGDDVELWYLNI